MCFGIEGMLAAQMSAGQGLMLAATAFNVASSITRGQEEKSYRNFQAAQASADARAEREYSQIQADKTRRAGKSQQSEARAALAAGGVEVDSGTPLRIYQEIERRSEVDALQQILYGDRKGERLDQEASAQRIAGDRAYAGGIRGAVGSALRGGANMMGPGWVSVAKRDTSSDFLYDAYDSGVVRIG